MEVARTRERMGSRAGGKNQTISRGRLGREGWGYAQNHHQRQEKGFLRMEGTRSGGEEGSLKGKRRWSNQPGFWEVLCKYAGGRPFRSSKYHPSPVDGSGENFGKPRREGEEGEKKGGGYNILGNIVGTFRITKTLDDLMTDYQGPRKEGLRDRFHANSEFNSTDENRFKKRESVQENKLLGNI